MSEENKPTGLTTGFTTISEIRKDDPHENVYADKSLLIPTLGVLGVCLLGLIFAIIAAP